MSLIVMFIAFLILKITGIITWSWLWVTSPLWITAIAWALWFVFFTFTLVIGRRVSKSRDTFYPHNELL